MRKKGNSEGCERKKKKGGGYRYPPMLSYHFVQESENVGAPYENLLKLKTQYLGKKKNRPRKKGVQRL